MWTLSLACLPALALGEETKENNVVSVSDGAIQFTAPKGWEKRKPKVNLIEAEFAAPAVGEDKAEVRITLMGAGGNIDANIERWVGQFQAAGGGPLPKEGVKREKSKINEQVVHTVDLAGTYLDKPTPFVDKGTPRENWRMLGAILVTEKAGNYFVKLYGPAAAVAAQEGAFKEFLGSVKVK